mmetsp:Transcript_77856/g.216278  ORF Transcript_77856/g.216278 Transcript_77856/m.216278 type:complete len:257 (-) Transcript_77856:619-1389(-)
MSRTPVSNKSARLEGHSRVQNVQLKSGATNLFTKGPKKSQLRVLRFPGALPAEEEAERVQELRGRARKWRLQVRGHDALERPARHVLDPFSRLCGTAPIDEEPQERVDNGRCSRECVEVRVVLAPRGHKIEGDGLVPPLLWRDGPRCAVVAVGLQDFRRRGRQLQRTVGDQQGPRLLVEERCLREGVRDRRGDVKDFEVQLVQPRGRRALPQDATRRRYADQGFRLAWSDPDGRARVDARKLRQGRLMLKRVRRHY